MKKIHKLFMMAIVMMTISSCRLEFDSTSTSAKTSIVSSTSDVISSSSTSVSSKSSTSPSESTSNSISNSTSTSSSVVPPSNLKTLSLTSNIDVGSYDTNWGETSLSGFDFEYYRAGNNYAGLLTLQTQETPFNSVESLEGMFYNVSPIYNIFSISITYRTASATRKPILRYGDNKLVRNVLEMDILNKEGTCTLNVYNNCNFFKIETNKANMLISSITIKYTNEKASYDSNYLSSGLDKNRLNPIISKTTLVDGVTSISAPIRVEYGPNNTYQVIEEKEYTYYSYDYISSHPNLALKAALVDPRDVSIYFNTFKTYPANYVNKKDYYDAYDIFGENTRCVSRYSRTDGYAESVPYATYYGSNKPVYFECDIALDDSYSSNRRGSARVVVWLYGFDQSQAIGYDDSPVSVYTDDHYSTFCEYLNDGTFGHFFNAEQNVTSYIWGSPKTFK